MIQIIQPEYTQKIIFLGAEKIKFSVLMKKIKVLNRGKIFHTTTFMKKNFPLNITFSYIFQLFYSRAKISYDF